MNVYAAGLGMLYLPRSAALAPVPSTGRALATPKWLSDRRGLAVSLTSAGFGAGSAVTIIPIQAIIKSGYGSAMLYFGIAQGVIVMLVALGLTDPRRVGSPALANGWRPPLSPEILQTTRRYRPL